jgi:rSAM/selenodomain-associated transferase 1
MVAQLVADQAAGELLRENIVVFMNNDLLILFLRNPIPGRVKTRIAERTGNKIALAVYYELLSATIAKSAKVKADRVIYFSDYNDESILPADDFETCTQVGNDLGERMKNAFSASFTKHYSRIVLIGSDCYELSPEIIYESFTKLSDHDCVIGPAYDGGYYLIGLSKEIPELFRNIPWSSASVFNQTVKVINKRKLSCYHLKTLHDVDTLDDVMRYTSLRKFIV